MENATNHSPGPGMAQRSSSLPGPRPTDPENLPVNSRTRLIRKAVQPAGIAEFCDECAARAQLKPMPHSFLSCEIL